MTAFRSINLMIMLMWLYVIFILSVFCSPLINSDTNTLKGYKKTEVKKRIATKPELVRGKALFKNNCASCHNKNMKDDLVGPALKGVTARWAAYPKKDLYNWIRNSSSLIRTEHPAALKIWKKWDKLPMPAMLQLKEEDIDDLLEFIES